MSLQLLPRVRRLLALRPPPSRETQAVFDRATHALYGLVEVMCNGVDAIEYARRIVTHPSRVIRAHARARLERQRAALTTTYETAHAALTAAIETLEG